MRLRNHWALLHHYGSSAVEGGTLSGDSVTFNSDWRIILKVLKSGLGLAQVGDVGKAFQLAAFQGEADSYS